MPVTVTAVLDPPAALRRLRADEAPYPGTLHAGDPQTVWVDAETVPPELWGCTTDGHLLAPHDVARTAAGHAVVMIHCPDHLTSYLGAGRRPGEVVTIAVSVLRAAEEARRAGIDTGTWWVDAAGRPVLAAGGPSPWEAEAAGILEELGRAERTAPAGAGRHSAGRRGAGLELADALEAAAELIGRPRLHADDVVACEEALFAVTAPEPLTRGGAVDELALLPRRAASLRQSSDPSAVRGWLARFTDAEWAERVTDATRSVAELPERLRERRRHASPRPVEPRPLEPRRRDRRRDQRPSEPKTAPRARRRAPLLIAVAVGALVLAGGLLWPEPGSHADGGLSPTPKGTARVAADAAAAGNAGAAETDAPSAAPPPGDGDAGAGGDLVEIARGMVRALSACGDDVDASCAALREDPSSTSPSVAVRDPAAAEVTLVDEYGGVAVFRVEGDGASEEEPQAQIVVLVSVDGKWLVRDVYDVADQP